MSYIYNIHFNLYTRDVKSTQTFYLIKIILMILSVIYKKNNKTLKM